MSDPIYWFQSFEKYIWKRLKLSDTTEIPDKYWLVFRSCGYFRLSEETLATGKVVGHLFRPCPAAPHPNKFLSHMQQARGHSCYRWLPRHTSTTPSSSLSYESYQLISLPPSLLWILPYTPYENGLWQLPCFYRRNTNSVKLCNFVVLALTTDQGCPLKATVL